MPSRRPDAIAAGLAQNGFAVEGVSVHELHRSHAVAVIGTLANGRR